MTNIDFFNNWKVYKKFVQPANDTGLEIVMSSVCVTSVAGTVGWGTLIFWKVHEKSAQASSLNDIGLEIVMSSITLIFWLIGKYTRNQLKPPANDTGLEIVMSSICPTYIIGGDQFLPKSEGFAMLMCICRVATIHSNTINEERNAYMIITRKLYPYDLKDCYQQNDMSFII